MAKQRASVFNTFLYLIALLSLSLSLSLSLLLHHISISATADSHSERFDADDDIELHDDSLSDTPRRTPPSTILSTSDPESHHGRSNSPSSVSSPPVDSDLSTKPSVSPSSFDFCDEDEFEGFPTEIPPPETSKTTEPSGTETAPAKEKNSIGSYTVEITCVLILVLYAANYFTGKKENETLALALAARFASTGSIFEKNFSLSGVGEGEDSPLLLKEGQSVFKFYASGRRFCQGVLGTMELGKI